MTIEILVVDDLDTCDEFCKSFTKTNGLSC